MLDMYAIAAKVTALPVFASGSGNAYDWHDAVNSGNTGTDAMTSTIEKGGAELQNWAAIIVGALGVVALLVGSYMLVKMLMAKSHGDRPNTSWAMIIIVLAVGGVMAVGGFGMAMVFGDMLASTVPSPK